MKFYPPQVACKKTLLAVLWFASFGFAATAQTTTTYPIDEYTEPTSATTPDATAWASVPSGLNASWASRDKRYAIHDVPVATTTETKSISVWKGERANVLAVLFSATDQGSLKVRMTEWKKNGVLTGITTAAQARFVNYVITDDFNDCGVHDTSLDTYLSADIIDQEKAHDVAAMTTRPVWCTVDVPTSTEAGQYVTNLEVVNASDKVVKTLTLNIRVVDKTLPLPSEQTFHLDLWQQPYAVSRYYGVDRWSDEHLEALRPYLKALARAGQSVVTTIMFYEPWGEQSHDKFDPMVKTTLKSDGTWSYDYTIFDKYVNLCAECGISKQINCFSMVPWDMSFRYYDESSSSYKTLTTTTSSTSYKNLWNNFLTSFKAHLQEKGWFDKTHIAMDERAESDMLNAYNIANNLGFKVALAGNYHSSLVSKLSDFCVALGQDKNFSASDLATRKANGRVTTIYTSCSDSEPNIFTNSEPAEATYLPLYAAANNMDGYLHWSFMNWDEHPLTDSRFRKFQAGDTYCYYPGDRSSVRFERLIEGIHQFEKVQILKEEYKNDAARLDSLNTLLSCFTSSSIAGEECAKYVNNLEAFLNGDEVEMSGAQALKTGYYHIISQATARTENIYNNSFLSGNTYKYTLQSDTKVETNNGIWKVTVNGDKTISVVNGDGLPMVAGNSNVGGIAGTFSTLTLADSTDVGEYRYYYFSEAVNCSNGGNAFKVNGTDYITTWPEGAKTAADLLWRFEPVSTDDRFVYQVDTDGNANLYVAYTHDGTTENAYNGGFFLTSSALSTANLAVMKNGSAVSNMDITIEEGVIKVRTKSSESKNYLKTGYYHVISKATKRAENLYNDAFLGGNSYKFTLQSDTKTETNNGIWHVKNNGNKTISIVNGDGQPMVAGASGGGSVVGTFSTLTLADSTDVDGYRYYYFSEAIDCTNGGNVWKVGSAEFITTWTDGTVNDDDVLWRFEEVSTDGRFVYHVDIDDDDVYVAYTHDGTTEKAFNGGFFLVTSALSTASLTAGSVGDVLNSADITIENGVIKVRNIDQDKAPERQDLFNTSNGDGTVPPYRIPGIAKAYNGRLIATAARLVCGTDPGYGQVDVVCRTSDNNGETWSDIQEVAVGNGITSATENYFETAFGDPAVVADRTSPEVMVLAVGGCTLFTSSNTTRSNPNLIALIRSHDNGTTWETPVNITEDVYTLFDDGNALEAAFVGGGRVFQSRIVKKGDYYRVYAALAARPNGNRVIYSDDFGKTWHALGGSTALPVPNGDEPKCDELPDGRVIITSRTAGGRYFNIFTYTNTLEGEGSWGATAKGTFEGSGLTPGNNATNGEMLVLPVTRKSDSKDMYLVLQSIPTGSTRTNVGIYYKELTDLSDLNTVANFAKDWNGFFQVSNTASAYSSMEWQADNKIGFFWEETLTSFGKRQNPVTTSFPTGSGTHNFDGFDNLYAPYSLEYITGSAYSINTSVDRGAFLKSYFTAYAEASSLTDGVKQQITAAANALTSSPTTAEVDAIYQLIVSGKEADKWDGKTVTLTNVQQNGDEYVLYVDDSNTLKLASASTSLGEKAQFLCSKKAEGIYTFYNENASQYMIWRAADGKDFAYNNNSGTLSEYNSTYCNFTVVDASGTKDNTYYLVSKRKDGTTDGSFVVMATGVFDSWGNSAAWSSNYSNLFHIDVVETPTAIRSLDQERKSTAIYDLSGRRVEKVQKGIYIINGKKVLVR